MPEVWFAVPGELTTLTGGYVYAQRLIAALPAAGWKVHHLPLPASFPNPTTADLAETRRLFATMPKKSLVLVDALAFGAMPRSVIDGLDLTFVALVHHPLALETGLSPARASELRESERAILECAKAVIVSSPTTAEVLARDYGVPQNRLHVAMPGTDPAARARGSNQEPCLVTVATLTPRKGHDVLVRALATLRDLPWKSVWVGSDKRDETFARTVRDLIAAQGLSDRIFFKGELTAGALDTVYAEADVFVLPSHYEGYGMVFAEALARGLPIIACAAGAVTRTVPADAGVLVPPNDPGALAGALRRVLTDKAFRTALSDHAWVHGQRLPRWSDTAARVAAALRAAA